jgi:hypothetical protein
MPGLVPSLTPVSVMMDMVRFSPSFWFPALGGR